MSLQRVTHVGSNLAPLTFVGAHRVTDAWDAAAATTAPQSVAPTETFESYYARDYRRLLGLAYMLAGSNWAAEDLVQDALTEAHRRWATVADYDDPGAWVRRVLVNKSTSRFRRLRTETKGLLRLSGQAQHPISPSEPNAEVWEAVRSLPPRQAQAIALQYWEDRPVAEIADILGCSPETVKTHLKRGRTALATMLQSHRPDSMDGGGAP